MIRIAFRLDDPSATSNHALEAALIAQLAAREAVATFAVIPFRVTGGTEQPLQPEHVPHLIAACRERHIEVALHGYRHVPSDARSAATAGEFVGIDCVTQRRWLELGRTQLFRAFEVEPVGFIPPWNASDDSTLDALRQCGFSYMSAGRGPKRDAPLPILPFTCHVNDVREAVEEAYRWRHTDPVIIVLMHHFDFTESQCTSAAFDVAQFGRLLDWLGRCPGLAICRLADLAQTIDNRCHRRLLTIDQWTRRFPWRITQRLPRHCIPTRSLWRAPRRHPRRT